MLRTRKLLRTRKEFRRSTHRRAGEGRGGFVMQHIGEAQMWCEREREREIEGEILIAYIFKTASFG